MHHITCKITKEGLLEPSNSEDRCLLVDSLSHDVPYKIKISKGRTLSKLGMYWLICTALAYYRDAGSKDWWSLEMKKMYFGFKSFVNPITGKISEEVESVSFERMDEIRFNEYLEWIKMKLAELDINWKEYVDNYQNRVR